MALPGYNFIHKPRTMGEAEGLESLLIERSNRSNQLHTIYESLIISISQRKRADLVVGAIYSPPGRDTRDDQIRGRQL